MFSIDLSSGKPNRRVKSRTPSVARFNILLRSPQHTLPPKLRRLLPRPFRRGWGEGLLGIVYPAVLAVSHCSDRGVGQTSGLTVGRASGPEFPHPQDHGAGGSVNRQTGGLPHT